MRTPSNPVLRARDAIPAVSVRKTGLDHHRAPTDAEIEALSAGTAPGNGKDIADLVHLLLLQPELDIGELAKSINVAFRPRCLRPKSAQ